MARKHGFRGTPVKPSLTPSSVAGIFERRGNPLVSAREGREKFGRNIETENPDLDQYFAERAVLKPSQIDKGNAFRKHRAALSANPDPQMKALQIHRKYQKRLERATVKVPDKPIEKEKEPKPINRYPGLPRFYDMVRCEKCQVSYDRMRWDSCPCCNPKRR